MSKKKKRKKKERLHDPPHPLTLTPYPTPGELLPHFYHQNDLDVLKRLLRPVYMP